MLVDPERLYEMIRGLTFRPAGGASFAGGGSFGFSRADVQDMSVPEFLSHCDALEQLRADELVALASGAAPHSAEED